MHYVNFIYPIIAAVLWGIVYTIDQKILYDLSPLALIFISSLIGLIITIPFLATNLEEIKSILNSGKTVVLLILVTTILATAANYAIFVGIKNLNASIASVFEISYPFFVILFSALVFGYSLNLWFFLGTLLIFAGSAIIILKV